jgi:hypothetical protein
MKVTVCELSKRQVIRRFINLPKLFELLVLGRMFCPTVGALAKSDPYECALLPRQKYRNSPRPLLKKRAMELMRFLPEALRHGDQQEYFKRYEELVGRCPTHKLRSVVLEMESCEVRERIVCSCWYSGDSESDAMWKLYANELGVALVSDVGRLARSIKGAYSLLICSYDPQEYTIAPIRYVDERDLGRLKSFYVDRPWMLKRRSFAHEQEIRLFHRLAELASARAGGKAIEVNAGKMIKEIVLSPLNPPWVTDTVRSTIELILETRELKIPIRTSEHLRPPLPVNTVFRMMEIDKLRRSLGSRSRTILKFK